MIWEPQSQLRTMAPALSTGVTDRGRAWLGGAVPLGKSVSTDPCHSHTGMLGHRVRRGTELEASPWPGERLKFAGGTSGHAPGKTQPSWLPGSPPWHLSGLTRGLPLAQCACCPLSTGATAIPLVLALTPARRCRLTEREGTSLDGSPEGPGRRAPEPHAWRH